MKKSSFLLSLWAAAIFGTGLFFLCVIPLPCIAQSVEMDLRLVSDEIMYPVQNSPDDSMIPFAKIKSSGFIKGELTAPVASTNDDRTCFDTNVQWDATDNISYTLDVEYSDPTFICGIISFYLHSGDGWYSMTGTSVPMKKPGQKRFCFYPVKARTEGKPGGLHEVDAIRIAFYRREAKDVKIKLVSLTSQKPSALILTEEGTDPKNLTHAKSVAQLLKNVQVAARTVSEKKLSSELLQSFPVVILPYQEKIKKTTVKLLSNYMSNGGFLVACYSLPEELMTTMGFGPQTYYKPAETAVKLAKMKLDPYRVKSFNGLLPDVIPQPSHNIQYAFPLKAEELSPSPFFKVKKNAPSIFAWWYDAEGKRTAYPAMLVSGRGLFVSHVLYSGRTETARLLKTLCLERDQLLRRETLRVQWRNIFTIGRSLDDDVTTFSKKLLTSYQSKLVRDGWKTNDIFALLNGEGDFAQFTRFSQALTQLEQDEIARFCRSVPSKKQEGRLWWEHSGVGAYPGNWDRTIKELADAGFNGVIPNMLWGGTAHYKSEFLPPHKQYLAYGDQVEQVVKACRKYGLEVHVWKVNFNMLNASKEFVAKMRAEGRTQCSLVGEEKDWLCPSHPENQKLEINVMLEVATKYDIDGIHFDYIRYDGGSYCFCNGCCERFGNHYFEKTGKKIADLKKEYLKDPEIKAEFARWKADQITAVVRGVRQRVDRECPRVKISAAVFRDWPSCRDTFGQDWVKWIKEGYLDFICPMDYSNNLKVFDTWVKDQLKLVDGKIPLYPGIGLWSSSSRLRSDEMAVQIQMTRKLGAQGFTVFSLSKTTLAENAPLMKTGATSIKATFPHRQK